MPYFSFKHDGDEDLIYCLDNDKDTLRNVPVFNITKNSYENRNYTGENCGYMFKKEHIECILAEITDWESSDSFYYKNYQGIFRTYDSINWIDHGVIHIIISANYNNIFLGGTTTKRRIGCEIKIYNPDGWTFTFNELPPNNITVSHNDEIVGTFDAITNNMLMAWLRANYNY